MNRFPLISVVLLALIGCSTHPPRKYVAPPRNGLDSPDSLYSRLGREEGLKRIVDDFVARIVADPRVNIHRRGTSHPWEGTPDQIAALKVHFFQYLSGLAGGPGTYEGKQIVQVHANMKITNQEFDAFLEDLKKTLDTLSVDKGAGDDLIRIIAQTREEIVEEASR